MMHTHTSQCRELLGSISAYVDGSLEEELCRELERHMSECDDCRVVVDTLRKTISLYRTESMATDVPLGVRERLFKRLNLEDFMKKS